MILITKKIGRDNMKILVIGDIVSSAGCEFVRDNLNKIKREHSIDIVIANGENSAIGNGMLPKSANHILDSGVDVITSGNHIYKRFEIYDYLDSTPQVIRPLNYPKDSPGFGYYILDKGSYKVCVINLLGQIFMPDNVSCPFKTFEEILPKIDAQIILIDFHGEATSEKLAFAHFVDGKVNAVFGTHTHVQTADNKILPFGTAYISDIGMVGPINSVLGVNPENIIKKMKTSLHSRFEISENPCQLDAAIIEIDNKTFKTISIERTNKK